MDGRALYEKPQPRKLRNAEVISRSPSTCCQSRSSVMCYTSHKFQLKNILKKTAVSSPRSSILMSLSRNL